jgi:anti-sigma factor RsiW
MSESELPPESPISGDAVSETELHAWLDGELPAERCAAVTAYFAAHPEVAARMRRHREQMQLMRRAFEPLLDRPPPRAVTALLAAGSRAVLWRRRAVAGLAAACLAVLLLAAGWLAHRVLPGGNYVAEAVTAYRLAVIDRAANGVWAITPEGLPGTLERLSRRVGVPLKVPALADQGFTITSGRLVPASAGATAAQFIYQRGSGQQLTI